MSTHQLDSLIDEWALRRLVQQYASAVDRNDGALFASLFLEDAVVEGPGFRFAGHEQLRAVPGQLAQQFRGTMHCVFNQLVTIAGDSASGETYCIASHGLVDDAGRPMTLDWAIRYQDRFVRRGAEWRIAYRRLVVQWTRTGPVELLPG
ncbi:MAG: nuclear transport factor 2 family protein [Steroidobacteraceae bacterium]